MRSWYLSFSLHPVLEPLCTVLYIHVVIITVRISPSSLRCSTVLLTSVVNSPTRDPTLILDAHTPQDKLQTARGDILSQGALCVPRQRYTCKGKHSVNCMRYIHLKQPLFWKGFTAAHFRRIAGGVPNVRLP